MKLDLRLPIGLMFSIFGVLLLGFGVISDAAIYQRSLGINVNLWWGVVLLVFGLVMLGFALRARGAERGAPRLARAQGCHQHLLACRTSFVFAAAPRSRSVDVSVCAVRCS